MAAALSAGVAGSLRGFHAVMNVEQDTPNASWQAPSGSDGSSMRSTKAQSPSSTRYSVRR